MKALHGGDTLLAHPTALLRIALRLADDASPGAVAGVAGLGGSEGDDARALFEAAPPPLGDLGDLRFDARARQRTVPSRRCTC